MQRYLDHSPVCVAMNVPGMGRSEEMWVAVSRYEGIGIHDMIEHWRGWTGPWG